MDLSSRLRTPLALCVLALAIVCLATAPRPALAQHAAPRASNGRVTIMILDMSGSMAQNDPAGLRCSAANAYIDLSGPGDEIGVIGLDNNNATGRSGGPHNFRLAQTWAQPAEMATVAERQQLRQTIARQSNNCRPDGNTPTYDALNQALGMLNGATRGGTIPGSVILLTDGAPDPDGAAQIAAIRADLLPQFKQHGWPVDSVALGADTSYTGFLSDLANGTAGLFFDDSHGPVAGVSPLNLESFFIDIFKIRNGRTPGTTIPPTALSGGTLARNFAVGDYVSHLDVIAVKDQPGTTVTITAPGGQTITATQAGAFVATDPHYVIFSLDTPQTGPWQLNVTGGGEFLMDSLVVSTLALAITAPAKGQAEPLGQPVTITAQLRDQGNGVVGQFQVSAIISNAGNGTFTPVEVTLSDPNGSGDYSATVTLPLSAPAGSYTIAVTARSVSADAVATTSVAQFTLFPTPELLAPDTLQPTTAPITAHVVTWDAGLRLIYSQAPPYSSTLLGWHPSDWPLGGLAANSQAMVRGVVLVGGQHYSSANVRATATRAGSGAVIPLRVENESDGNGTFRLYFPAGSSGQYTVTLTETGNFKDTFGALATVSTTLAVTVGYPSTWDEVRAWLITALYTVALALFLIFFVYGPVNYVARAKPNKRARLIDNATNQRARSRSQMDPGTPLTWRGWSLRRYFAPNRLPAHEVALPENLEFVFRHGNEVAVRVRPARGKDLGAQWSVDGRRLTPADGVATIVTRSRLSYAEAGRATDLIFEQDTPNVNDAGGGRSVTGRVEEAAGTLGLRDRFRRARGLRND